MMGLRSRSRNLATFFEPRYKNALINKLCRMRGILIYGYKCIFISRYYFFKTLWQCDASVCYTQSVEMVTWCYPEMENQDLKRIAKGLLEMAPTALPQHPPCSFPNPEKNENIQF
ncbi:hypothetical protein DAPPUDRAFT_238578 [Daphnia pulex]|uniref:Uncharacterized protein n=1 Tax=Daphnia pulex TaxID=6669 RepID=E9G833_DAPPU|nr:hypothetical protein DAPPUDRAFT_238578 [Daphnia pulex]|eukprot:EFX84345.1 hypothetical protein DAPPUDRAFT_238578 [Daphnia pulex]